MARLDEHERNREAMYLRDIYGPSSVFERGSVLSDSSRDENIYSAGHRSLEPPCSTSTPLILSCRQNANYLTLPESLRSNDEESVNECDYRTSIRRIRATAEPSDLLIFLALLQILAVEMTSITAIAFLLIDNSGRNFIQGFGMVALGFVGLVSCVFTIMCIMYSIEMRPHRAIWTAWEDMQRFLALSVMTAATMVFLNRSLFR